MPTDRRIRSESIGRLAKPLGTSRCDAGILTAPPRRRQALRPCGSGFKSARRFFFGANRCDRAERRRPAQRSRRKGNHRRAGQSEEKRCARMHRTAAPMRVTARSRENACASQAGRRRSARGRRAAVGPRSGRASIRPAGRTFAAKRNERPVQASARTSGRRDRGRVRDDASRRRPIADPRARRGRSTAWRPQTRAARHANSSPNSSVASRGTASPAACRSSSVPSIASTYARNTAWLRARCIGLNAR